MNLNKKDIKISDSIENMLTCKLVEELAKREGVREIIADPYCEYTIKVGDKEIHSSGPVIILEVID